MLQHSKGEKFQPNKGKSWPQAQLKRRLVHVAVNDPSFKDQLAAIKRAFQLPHIFGEKLQALWKILIDKNIDVARAELAKALNYADLGAAALDFSRESP